jgi:protein ImuB
MRWVAIHFPQLRRQALLRGHALPEPERGALRSVAGWACQFTPRVALEPPHALLLEVESSLPHFGGRWRFLAQLRGGLSTLGFEAHIAEAPTARAALWQARGNGGRLDMLPLAVLDLASEARELLSNLGIQTVGGLMRLPREGAALRLGAKLLREIDQAAGRLPESHEFFVPPEQFSERLLLPAPVVQAEQALFVVRRLLDQMAGFLASRHAAIRDFSLGLLHEHAAVTRIGITLTAPSRDARHWGHLLRDRLAVLSLQAPVAGISLDAGKMEPLIARNGEVMAGMRSSNGEEWRQCLERLQSRLGDEAVHGIDVHADHRPERAWVRVAPGSTDSGQDMPVLPRPLWLLDTPRKLTEGEFSLLAGPERIASGWWDGAEIFRDYFVARIGRLSLAWIYREREEGWFLHGYFA